MIRISAFPLYIYKWKSKKYNGEFLKKPDEIHQSLIDCILSSFFSFPEMKNYLWQHMKNLAGKHIYEKI